LCMIFSVLSVQQRQNSNATYQHINNYYVFRVCVFSLRYPAPLSSVSSIAKIRPVEAELFHADGRTDGNLVMTELIVASHNLTNLPKTKSTWKRNLFWKTQ
jgi:hypothetical protein